MISRTRLPKKNVQRSSDINHHNQWFVCQRHFLINIRNLFPSFATVPLFGGSFDSIHKKIQIDWEQLWTHTPTACIHLYYYLWQFVANNLILRCIICGESKICSMYWWKHRKEIEQESKNDNKNKGRKINLENGLNEKRPKKAPSKDTQNENGQCPKYWTIGESAHGRATCAKRDEYDQCINKWLNKGIRRNQPTDRPTDRPTK